MNSSNREKAAAASAEHLQSKLTEAQPNETPATQTANSEFNYDENSEYPESSSVEDEIESTTPTAATLVPPEFDLDDFDDEFDDDFEAETAGEYELDDDEYARALLDIVDFEIEGLEAYRDEE